MRSLSQNVQHLLAHIRRLWTAPAAASTDIDADITAAFDAIAEATEPASIPSLLQFLSDSDSRVGHAAAAAIHRIVHACDPLDLARLDVPVRQVSDAWWWGRPSPDAVVRMARGFTGTVGVLSCGASGYEREAAVEALANAGDGLELPFLLIRLNDWVARVRGDALAAVLQRVRPDYARHFIRSLPLVYRLAGQSRVDHRPVIEAVSALLRAPGSRAALRETMSTGPRQRRRMAFRLLVSGGGEDLRPILEDALASRDTVLRLHAGRELRARLQGDALRGTLDRMKRDRFMPVRREALYGFAEKLPESARAEMEAALLDPHPSVREAARYLLRQLGAHNPAAFYRDRLDGADEGTLALMVAGLGESGAAPDAIRLAAFLTHPNSRVRRAAVRAVGRIDAAGFVEPLLDALQDPAPAVSKAAAAALRRQIYGVPPARLSSVFYSDQRPHVRRVILKLVAQLTWWDAAPVLLAATADADERVRDRASGLLTRWTGNIGRLTVQPSAAKIAALEDALNRYGGRVGARVREDAASLVAHAKREPRARL